jgi:hypothetical protein
LSSSPGQDCHHCLNSTSDIIADQRPEAILRRRSTELLPDAFSPVHTSTCHGQIRCWTDSFSSWNMTRFQSESEDGKRSRSRILLSRRWSSILFQVKFLDTSVGRRAGPGQGISAGTTHRDVVRGCVGLLDSKII